MQDVILQNSFSYLFIKMLDKEKQIQFTSCIYDMRVAEMKIYM